MKWIRFLILTLALPAFAQTTNYFGTDIEAFEAMTNAIVVKGFGTSGTVNIGAATFSVRLKDSFSPDAGGHLQGLVLEFSDGVRREHATVDYTELDSLIKAFDFVRSVTYDVTHLPGFEAQYQTKDKFRVIALGSHRQSAVQTYIQFDNGQLIALDSDQISQVRNVIAQGRDALNELRTK